jgi:hypothetical protein
VERAHQHIRDPRERLAGLLRRHRPRQDAGADQKHLLLGEDADAVEIVLVARRLREETGKRHGEVRLLGQRAEEGRIDHRVDDFREVRETLGKPRCRPNHKRDQRDHVRVLPQQRQQAAAALEGCEKPVKRN